MTSPGQRMKVFKGFSCFNSDAIQTIPPPSSNPSSSLNEKNGVKRSPKSTSVDSELRENEPPLHVHFSRSADTENSSSDCGSIPAAVVMASTIFQSKPKPREDLAPIIHRQNSGGTTVSASHDWGYPEHLSQEQYEIYVKFHHEACQRSLDFQQTIYSFGTVETEEFALCRWLRARKFDLEKTIQMVEEAMEFRKEAAKHYFFPDGSRALGVEKSIFYALYPEVFGGYTKNGFPLFIIKACDADFSKVPCITTMTGVINFHWHSMAHVLGGQLRDRALADPSFKRFEACTVVDVEGVSVSTALDSLSILKEWIAIDQLCFPECLHSFIFINAPATFSAVWRVCRTFIDPHTASKVEIISKKAVWQARLIELFGAESLPSDYGGMASSFIEKYEARTTDGDLRSQVIHPVFLRTAWSWATYDFNLNSEDEVLELVVLTNTQRTGTFTVLERRDSGDEVIQVVEVKHSGQGDDQQPTRVNFPQTLNGPGSFQVRVNCSEGQGSWVLVGKVCDKSRHAHRRDASTMIMRSERRYSNFHAISQSVHLAGEEVRNVEPRSLSTLRATLRSMAMSQQSERLKTPLFQILAFIVALVIHDILFYFMIQKTQYSLKDVK